MGTAGRCLLFRIKSHTIILNGDLMPPRFPLGGYRHQTILSITDPMADRIFHQGLNRQCRNIKLINQLIRKCAPRR